MADDTGASSLSLFPTSIQAVEGGPGATTNYRYTVNGSNLPAGVTTVSWTLNGSGASPAGVDDFVLTQPFSGTLSFTPDSPSQGILVQVKGDTALEGDEGFVISLQNSSGPAIQTAVATGVILNDDGANGAPAPSLAISPPTLSHGEGAPGGFTSYVFTVTASDLPTSGMAGVNWTVSGSGAHPAELTEDFQPNAPLSGSLIFSGGFNSETITVRVAGDDSVETDETFQVLLSSPTGATLGVASATGVIVDDDLVVPTTGTASQNFQIALAGALSVGLFEQKTTLAQAQYNAGSSDAGLSTIAKIVNILAEVLHAQSTPPFELLKESLIDVAGPTSGAVLETYQALLGVKVTPAGLAYLVDSPDNPNDLTDPYYAPFNEENRFINLSVSLATGQGEAATRFANAFDHTTDALGHAVPLSFNDAVSKAYDIIIGDSYGSQNIDRSAAIGYIESQRPYFAAVTDGSDLQVKAAAFGYILSQAWDDKLGPIYSEAHDTLGGLIKDAATASVHATGSGSQALGEGWL